MSVILQKVFLLKVWPKLVDGLFETDRIEFLLFLQMDIKEPQQINTYTLRLVSSTHTHYETPSEMAINQKFSIAITKTKAAILTFFSSISLLKK